MRFALALLTLALPALAHAGIYNSAETEDKALSKNVSKFCETLAVVRSIGFEKVDVNRPLRQRYVLMEQLGGAKPSNTLNLQQKLDYSAVLLRRKKFQMAIDYLTPLTRQHPEIFLFDSHLAMAYWGSGQAGYDRRAVELQSQLLSKDGWPAQYDDLSPEQREFFDAYWTQPEFELYRKMETYLLKLMKLRLAEPAGRPFEAVDQLFNVKFVGDQGQFEPGQLAAAEKKKLPREALDAVEQLLLWLPEDLRLYWLLGEIANAEGTPDGMRAGARIFDELVFQYSLRADDLKDHWRALQDHVRTLDQPADFKKFEEELDNRDKKDKNPEGSGMPSNTRVMATMFVLGLAVGIFAVWQFQELRRRRRSA